MDVNEKKKNRFLFLNHLYEKSNSKQKRLLDMNELGSDLGFDGVMTKDIFDYFINEKLIIFEGKPCYIKLSHLGLKEIEDALSKPNQSTAHFAPITNYNIHINSSGQGNVINTGHNNNITLSNFANSNQAIDRVNEIIGVLKNDESLTNHIKEETIKAFTDMIGNLEQEKPLSITIDKLCAYGGSIASIGSLVLGLIQMISK
jgi:hypothetical protein